MRSAPARLRRAIAAGYPTAGTPPPIVYTADIFDHESLELVLQYDIPVNCGSPDMIEQYGRRAPGRNITLRINPGFGHGHSQKTNTGGEQSKHGIWHEQLEACLVRADHYGLGVTGLHMHIGSGTDMEHLAQVSGAMEQLRPNRRPQCGHHQRRRRTAGAVQGGRVLLSTLASTSSCGTQRGSGWNRISATP